MTEKQAQAFWERAQMAVKLARKYLEDDPDSAASKAYYAAFYAVSAWFALQKKSFRRHSAIRKAISEELIHPGKWPVELGKAYALLSELRSTADYGGEIHVSPEQAEKALRESYKILQAIKELSPRHFPSDDEKNN